MTRAFSSLTGTAVHHLSEPDAAALWEHLLARQGLAPNSRQGSAVEVADATLGLHAARLPSPFGIVASRSRDPAIPLTLFSKAVRAELLTVRCMRKTLHALPLPLAAAAHSATLRFRARDARRAAINAGVSNEDLDRAVNRILTVLKSGPLQHRVLEQRLASQGIPVPVGRIAIKTAWENGQIVYGNATTAWNREARTFALPATAYPGFVLDIDRGVALVALIEAYFDRYGPATIRDATWWSGLSAADILTALSSCGREVVRIRTPWAEADALMFADRLEDLRAADPVTTGVNLLAHEDTALKAYRQTRSRYLGDLPQRRAFNQIGEALPTVMVDGRIAGTWQWNPDRRAVVVSLARGRTSPSQRRQVKNAADALTATLRQAWTATSARPPDADGRQLLLTGTSE